MFTVYCVENLKLQQLSLQKKSKQEILTYFESFVICHNCQAGVQWASWLATTRCQKCKHILDMLPTRCLTCTACTWRPPLITVTDMECNSEQLQTPPIKKSRIKDSTFQASESHPASRQPWQCRLWGTNLRARKVAQAEQHP